jgi:hypothetical protein
VDYWGLKYIHDGVENLKHASEALASRTEALVRLAREAEELAASLRRLSELAERVRRRAEAEVREKPRVELCYRREGGELTCRTHLYDYLQYAIQDKATKSEEVISWEGNEKVANVVHVVAKDSRVYIERRIPSRNLEEVYCIEL